MAINTDNQNQINLPKLSLPKGGGTVRGIDENFHTDAFSGSASFDIPIPLPAARALTPSLGIHYSSGSGNGLLGCGFTISEASISRKTSRGIPTYSDTDVFMLGGSELVAQGDGTFLERHQSGFPSVIFDENTNQWTTISGDNITSVYGKEGNARVTDDAGKTFKWLLSEVYDSSGNKEVYTYEKLDTNDANVYLTKIAYGNYKEGNSEKFAFEVILDYANADFHTNIQYRNNNTSNAPVTIPVPNTPLTPLTPRKDIIHDHRAGFAIKTQYLIRNIWIKHHFAEYDGITHGVHFEYHEDSVMSFAKSITQTGYKKQTTGDTYTFKSTPPVDLSYSQFAANTQPQYKTIHTAQGEDLNLPLHLVDLEQEGMPGLLYRNAETVEYFTPIAGGFEDGKVLNNIPSGLADRHQAMNFISLEGDGALQVAAHQLQASGYYAMESFQSTETIQWSGFQAFEKESLNDLAYRTETVDLSGDNRADQVVITPEEIVYIPSLGKQGMGEQQCIPNTHKVEADNAANLNPFVYYGFADVFGDGLSHRVKVEDKKITIWANLGYGQFGKAQTVSISDLNIIEEHIDLRSQLQFADINGSGKADLVITYSDHVKVFINQNGQAFSAPIEIQLPEGEAWSPLDTLQFADIEGTGNTYLVFSKNGTTVKHYYGAINQATANDQLCHKAFLLHTISNNMGAENQIFYKSSLQDYLADKQSGKPWDTRMHSPVMVIEHSVTVDHISGTQITSQFKYRNGYYDPIEHQFLGFGYVEHIDTPKNHAATNDGSMPPPSLSKQWFHLGRGILKEENVTQTFFQSKLPTLQRYLDDKGKVTTNLNKIPEEALFALAGSEIHHEVWDGSPDVTVPFSMHTAAYTVVETVAPGTNKKGVYKVYGHESMEVDYEKVADDPHITHEFTLEVDPYNHPLKACAVAYPRVKPLIPQQGELHITAHTSVYQHQDEAGKPRWLGIDREDKSFEITGLTPQSQYFTFAEIKPAIDAALGNPLSYSDTSTAGKQEARLLSWQQHFYWRDETQQAIWKEGEALPAILLAHHHEFIELDDPLITEAFGDHKDQINTTAAGFINREGYYWNRSAVAHYDKGNFHHLIQVSNDWFDKSSYLYTESTVTYDDYHLFVTAASQRLNDNISLGSSVAIDYWMLHPTQMTDANGNISQVLLDELGAVIATSVHSADGSQGDAPLSAYHGKTPPSIGDILQHSTAYLQNAGSYFYYEFAAWDTAKKVWTPACHVALSRTEYRPTDDQHIQKAITYNDGFGRVIEAKHFAGTDGAKPWLASGRVTYNAKGHPYKAYLGYFADSWEHQADWDNAIKPHLPKPTITTYDALDRPVHVQTPKGYTSQSVFLNAWAQQHFDENDTQTGNPFYNTPTTTITDSLGRTVLGVQDNGASIQPSEIEQHLDNGKLFLTWQQYDIEGRVLHQSDPRFTTITQTGESYTLAATTYNFQHLYPIAGKALKTSSSDAGTHCSFEDIHGNTLIAWDALDYQHTTTYDNLQRPLTQSVKATALGLDQIVQRMEYGETAPQAKAKAKAKAKNLLGKVWKIYDGAGVTTTEGFTFDGHPNNVQQKFRAVYDKEANWQTTDHETLEHDVFTTHGTFDAAGRPLTQTTPDNSVTTWAYGRMGNCVKTTFKVDGQQEQEIIKGSTLDANGHLTTIQHGNGLQTHYAYEAETLFLKQMAIRKDGGSPLQSLAYTHDPTGLITQKTNQLEQPVFYNNQAISADNTYTYDALYRLKQATGRTLVGLNGQQKAHGFTGLPSVRSSDTQALKPYQESYHYDKSNNLITLAGATITGKTRAYTIDAHSNRVTAFQNGDTTKAIHYDQAGQMQALEEGGTQLTWNYHGNIAQSVNGSITEHYVYDHTGIRARKVTVQDGKVIDKRYLGAYRRTTKYAEGKPGSITYDRRVLTVSGVAKHDCVVDYYDQGAPSGSHNKTPIYRFQHGDHLNSVSLETNISGEILSYEEYTAFGETTYLYTATQLGVSAREYRYSAQEKDGTTSLYYYGYRYYAPWLCRWTRPDPAGTIDGLNLYAFVENEPVGKFDLMGLLKSVGGVKTRSGANSGKATRIRKKIRKVNFIKRIEKINILSLFEKKKGAKKENLNMLDKAYDNKKNWAVFSSNFRASARGQDEIYSTRNTFDSINEKIKNNKKVKEIKEFLNISHKLRMPTEFVGYKLKNNVQLLLPAPLHDVLQHPTSKQNAQYGTSGQNHGRWNIARTNHAIKGTGDIHKFKRALAFTLNTVQPPGAIGTATENSQLTKEQKLFHNLREHFKDSLRERGNNEGASTRRWKPRLTRDVSVSPPRKMY